MMRKVIYTIGFLMFLSAPLAPLMIHAADTSTTPSASTGCTPEGGVQKLGSLLCKLSNSLEYALQGKSSAGLDWGHSFGATDPAKVGQDLYLIVYKSTQTDTLDAAIKATAAQYGLPPERMSLILGGDITPILERSPLMRIDDAVNIYNQMVATYNDKKDSLEVEATLKAKVEPNEMFADGDLSNSGFDLINDLDNIEIILFQKNDLVTFGGTYSGSSGGETPPAGTTNPTVSPTTTGTLPVDLTGTSGGGGGGGTGAGGQGNNANASAGQNTPPPPLKSPFDTLKENKSPTFVGGINPSQCFAGDNIDNALNNFSKDAVTNKKLQSAPPAADNSGGTGAAATTSGVNANNAGGAGGIPNINLTTAPITTPTTTTPPAAPPLQAAPPGDYTVPPLCDSIICMSLDFIKKPATASFNKTDNCIQCHVQYINDGLQKTISHSLIPAKASGNLGESGLCKNAAGTALGSIGMNISINTVPIVTPAKDDLVTLGNITDEWASYAAKEGAWNYGEKERRRLDALKTGKPVDTSAIPDTIERQLLIEINNAPDNSTQADVLTKARTADDTAKAQETQDQLVAEISKDAYGQVDTLQALDDEMQSMNKYFDGFQRSMRTLLEDVPGLSSTKACVKLNNTQVCT